MGDVLTLPDELRGIVTWLMRRGEASLADVAEHLGADEESVRGSMEALIAGGFVRATHSADGARYQVRLVSRPARRASRDVFKALDHQ
jgi:predicted ArsR family transcriptional regulator